jgi:PleD family two-component response regulator
MELMDEVRSPAPKARILIVEDEVLIRMTLAEDLRDAGYSVIEASNADAAFEYLKTGSQVDLVFSRVGARIYRWLWEPMSSPEGGCRSRGLEPTMVRLMIKP